MSDLDAVVAELLRQNCWRMYAALLSVELDEIPPGMPPMPMPTCDEDDE